MATVAGTNGSGRDIGLRYDPDADAVYVRLRDVPEIERREDLGEGRLIQYADSALVGAEFHDVRRGIHTDGLPDVLAAVSCVATAFAALVRTLQDRSRPPTPTDAADGEDEEEYLLRSPANRERLLAAYRQALAGEGEIVDLGQLRRDVGLAEGFRDSARST